MFYNVEMVANSVSVQKQGNVPGWGKSLNLPVFIIFRDS